MNHNTTQDTAEFPKEDYQFQLIERLRKSRNAIVESKGAVGQTISEGPISLDVTTNGLTIRYKDTVITWEGGSIFIDADGTGRQITYTQCQHEKRDLSEVHDAIDKACDLLTGLSEGDIQSQNVHIVLTETRDDIGKKIA